MSATITNYYCCCDVGGTGPTGAPGSDGPTGPAGPQGPTGASAVGTSLGASWYNNTPVDFGTTASVNLMNPANQNFNNVGIVSDGTGGFTISMSGIYEIYYQTLASTFDTKAYIRILVNGNSVKSTLTSYIPSNTNQQQLVCRQLWYLNAADLVTIEGFADPSFRGVPILTGGSDIDAAATSVLSFTLI